jgi:hypothetical protein
MLTRTLSMVLTLALGLVAGCDGGETRLRPGVVRGAGEAPTERVAEADAVVLGAQILVSGDGATREEVVFEDGRLGPADGAEVVEIPEVITAALAGAPADVEAAADGRSMILMSEDGTVQEEVVFTDPADQGSPAAHVDRDSGMVVSLADAPPPCHG